MRHRVARKLKRRRVLWVLEWLPCHGSQPGSGIKQTPNANTASRIVFMSALGLFVGRFVVARFAARRTIEEPILAEANIQLALAQAAELFAGAFFLSHFALHADKFLPGTRSRAHAQILARWATILQVPEVTVRPAMSCLSSDKIKRLHALKILIRSGC